MQHLEGVIIIWYLCLCCFLCKLISIRLFTCRPILSGMLSACLMSMIAAAMNIRADSILLRSLLMCLFKSLFSGIRSSMPVNHKVKGSKLLVGEISSSQ